MKTLIFLFIASLAFSPLKEKHTDQKQVKIDLSEFDKVNIYNTGGAVKVTTNQGNNEAIVNVKRHLSATTKKKLTRAIDEIQLDTMVMDGELYIYISTPSKVLRSNGGEYLHYQDKDSYPFSSNGIKESGISYQFELDVNIPENTNMVVSTHRGDIELDGVQGDLAALNHHGNLYLTHVQNLHYAHSHHGVIDVSFDKQSEYDINFDTHHGDITVKFPRTPSADLELYSYHGSFFTDFDWKPGPLAIEKNSKGRKAKYKMGGKTRVLMGSADKKIKFNSHHGNMYILKN